MKPGRSEERLEGNLEEETIVAVSSPSGRASRGIVRLSGPHALRITSEIFQSDPPLSQSPTYTRVEGEARISGFGLAPVAVYIMREPYSYTREDVLEFHLAGSPAVLSAVLKEIISRGARIAQPGEFTLRAFLSGRIDLAQAEAVLKVIRSRSQAERNIALGELEGRLSRGIEALREKVTDLLATVELSIDFSDQDIEILSREELLERLTVLCEDGERILREGSERTYYDEGIITVIMGRTNVGKSSICNALLERPRSIVHSEPSTTRDPLDDSLLIDGVLFHLWDTAGMTTPRSPVDEEAISRSSRLLKRAQLPILVTDGSSTVTDEDRALFSEVSDVPCIVVVNKIDLGLKLARDEYGKEFPRARTAFTCAISGEGISELRGELVRVVRAGELALTSTHFALNIRQREALGRGTVALRRAEEGCRRGLGEELLASELRSTIDSLSELLGRVESEEILERIFSEFCIGK